MHLLSAIMHWNGKSTDDIETIYNEFHADSDFVSTLLELLVDKKCQIASTWLLKHSLEKGQLLSVDNVADFHEKLSKLIEWESKLHALQSFRYLPIAESSVKGVESFLRDTIMENNKFVRAWSYNGFYLLAKQYPSYQHEVEQFLNMGLLDEPPSVKARIRNVLKVGF